MSDISLEARALSPCQGMSGAQTKGVKPGLNLQKP